MAKRTTRSVIRKGRRCFTDERLGGLKGLADHQRSVTSSLTRSHTSPLEAAKRNVAEQRKQVPADEAAQKAFAQTEALLAAASATAQDAHVKLDQARRAAAEIRVWRERKMMSLGAGSKSAMKRAEAALQSLPPTPAK
jgi:hypothetical protein